MMNVDRNMRRMKRIADRFFRIENVIKSGFAPSIKDMDWIENIGGRPGYERLMEKLIRENRENTVSENDAFAFVKAGV